MRNGGNNNIINIHSVLKMFPNMNINIKDIYIFNVLKYIIVYVIILHQHQRVKDLFPNNDMQTPPPPPCTQKWSQLTNTQLEFSSHSHESSKKILNLNVPLDSYLCSMCTRVYHTPQIFQIL